MLMLSPFANADMDSVCNIPLRSYDPLEKIDVEYIEKQIQEKKSPIKESLGAASRVSGNVNTKKPIIETDPMVERFKKLAGIK